MKSLVYGVCGGLLVLSLTAACGSAANGPSVGTEVKGTNMQSVCDHGNRVYFFSDQIAVASQDPSCPLSTLGG